jgi:hypothetical protein
MQSDGMETNWAAENLQTIRTLMERSAIYRRALAPVMTYVGFVGIAGALAGRIFGVKSHHGFIYFWLAVCSLAVAGVFFLVRRQALRSAEPFWTPPTRRVVAALSPAFVLGGIATVLVYLIRGNSTLSSLMLPPVWIALYGCALHSAGFFMPRGVQTFAWALICVAAILLVMHLITPGQVLVLLFEGGDLPMGFSFGGLHLAFGIYLYLTEKRGNES